MFGSVGDDKQLIIWDTRQSGMPHPLSLYINFVVKQVGLSGLTLVLSPKIDCHLIEDAPATFYAADSNRCCLPELSVQATDVPGSSVCSHLRLSVPHTLTLHHIPTLDSL